MTFAEIVARVPDPGSSYKGSWVGFFLRVSFAPIIGLENARRLVADALGPGHDYYPLGDPNFGVKFGIREKKS